ncbi:hypothetical protein N800_03260 [Lysobacter daejeonensis GH1-9]|uniref:MobA-like NTP transferase domain-containing protein n=1 Tax=Lysobacter daejeonensis GH1-9 TaxID=1385517 RepID=A0A0A0EX90_9GAMM|nr:molybdenum cofactor guanylyltransferase [Lysobacter daejeonensis]KGM53777.1 hypothetical protein N800_03260 [Lysobacter daejeonensis GH1-9]
METTGTEPDPWTGVLLAGGRSSRMGRDKAHLAWRGQTLLAHACATLRTAGAANVIVSGHYPECAGIPDAEPGLGPLGGLASVVQAMPDGVLVVVPVDMPLLTPALLQLLASQDATACVAYRDHILPMRLRLDDRCRTAIARLVDDPAARRSLRALHEALGGEFIPAPTEHLAELVNCNTPQQWEAAAP